MKSLLKLSITSLVLVSLMAAVPAQSKKQKARTDEVTTRSIRLRYEAGEVDGMRVVIYKVEADKQIAVDPGREFKKGDRIRVEFESNFDGYVYFINIPPSGKKAVIFPDNKAKDKNNRIIANRKYLLPNQDTFEFVDDEQGTEIIQVVMSREPIAVFDKAINTTRGELGNAESASTDALAKTNARPAGIDTENVTPAPPMIGDSVLTRKARLVPPQNDQLEKGTVVAVPDNKLKPNEMAMFEIRLKHG